MVYTDISRSDMVGTVKGPRGKPRTKLEEGNKILICIIVLYPHNQPVFQQVGQLDYDLSRGNHFASERECESR